MLHATAAAALSFITPSDRRINRDELVPISYMIPAIPESSNGSTPTATPPARPAPPKTVARGARPAQPAKQSPGISKKKVGAVGAPKTSHDFMSNPQQGKVFISYFAEVKEKIHRVFRKRYERKEGSSEGVVCLSFVLNADGSLGSYGVVSDQTRASDTLKNFSVNCLKSAAPFGNFPKELNAPQIAFTVTIYFDEI